MAEHKEKEPAVSKDREQSTVEPVPNRVDFFEWLEKQFDGASQFPEKIHVCAVSGKNGERLGPAIKQIVFPPKMEKPSLEKLVAMSNEILYEIQNDCNAHNKRTLYGVHIAHFSRDSAFYARFPVSAQPALVGDTPDEDEDHPVEKRFGLQMLDHGERMFEMYGGANSGLLEHYRDALRESSIEISKLRTDNADLREQLERALSAREEREERRLWNALKVKGGERALDTALALMPPLVNKFLGEKVMDSKDTPETLALKPYFKVVAEGGLLSEEQREVIFGKFGDKPPFDQIAAGILSLDQGRILFQVASCEIPADELDRLLPGGDLAVTPDQLSALTSSGLSMAQLMPLQILFDDRLKKRAQKQ